MLRDRNPTIRVWGRTEKDRSCCLAKAIESRLIEGHVLRAEVEHERAVEISASVGVTLSGAHDEVLAVGAEGDALKSMGSAPGADQ